MSERFGTNDPIYDMTRLLSLPAAQSSTDDAITDLSGDVSATGPGAVTATLATVNANVGTFGSATQVAQVTVNGKGLVTAAANVTISGVTPAAHDIAGALHTTSGRTAGQVLQATGATTFGWSTNTLTISGNSTINGTFTGGGSLTVTNTGGLTFSGAYTLTVQKTGSAVVGSGTANYISKFSGDAYTLANSLIQDDGVGIGVGTAAEVASLIISRPTSTITSNTFNGLSMVLSANPAGASSATYQGISFLSQTTAGNAQTFTGSLRGITGNAYHRGTANLTNLTGIEAQVGYLNTGNVTTARGIRLTELKTSTGAPQVLSGIDIGDMTSGTILNSAILTGKGAVRLGDFVTVTGWQDARQLDVLGHTTQTNEVGRIRRNDGATNTVNAVFTIGANTTGTAAAGFGGSIALNLESSTTPDQAAAAIKWLWTDSTHATRTSRADIETTGPGKCAAWGYNGVDGTARTIIANGTGDVTEGITVQYVASEVTGTDSYGGIVYLEPSDSFAINTDGTNALTLACAADGSVTIQRTAGTDTYKVMLWMVWQ